MTDKAPRDEDIFNVSGPMNFFSWLICEHPGTWRRIANLETSLLADELDTVEVRAPIWVTGLARSGSTLVLEILSQLPGVVSLTYKDFPPVFTPYAWNQLLRLMQQSSQTPAERAHRDRILVTPDSPEAMEEPLWMSFFPEAHDPEASNVIGPGDDPHFAAFLDAHIRKLLRVRDGRRYLAKANYQVTRMEYLLDVYADARFVIPVREPVAHIASLMKQHALFSRGQRANPRARQHLQRVGHFEFGLDRQPINTGDAASTREIIACWNDDREIEGWARYWAQIYGYIADRLEASEALADAAIVISYSQLCDRPTAQLERLCEHCELDAGAEFIAEKAAAISAPEYYEPQFSASELKLIETLTADTRKRIEAYAAGR